MKPTQDIYTFEAGQGAPVVVLHGSISTGRQWRSLIEYIQGGFRVIAPDLPGYGKSSGVMVPADMASMAKSLKPILARQTEPVHLVGHSFGGAVAAKVAQMFPHLVKSLTVIEPVSFNLVCNDRDSDIDLEGVFETVFKMESAIDAGDNWGAMQVFVDFWNGDGSWVKTRFGLASKMAEKASQVMMDFEAIARDTSGWDELGRISCPVLALSGDRSPKEVLSVTDKMADCISHSQRMVVADAGHMVPLTDPHIVDVSIRKFLVNSEQQWQKEAIVERRAA